VSCHGVGLEGCAVGKKAEVNAVWTPPGTLAVRGAEGSAGACGLMSRVPIPDGSADMSSSTHIQIDSLYKDLASAKGHVSWQVGRIANALLEKAKQEQPDNVAIGVIEPFQPDSSSINILGMQADSVRAIVGQMATATYTGPSFA
jgi:hypothetical protein